MDLNCSKQYLLRGDAISIFNNTSGDRAITLSITTAYIAGTDLINSVTLATRGICTISVYKRNCLRNRECKLMSGIMMQILGSGAGGGITIGGLR